MKIYVKDIMPEDPIFWAELGMPVRDVLRVMVDRNFTLLPVRNVAKDTVGTATQRSILRVIGAFDSIGMDSPLSSIVLEPSLKIVEPFEFLDVVDDDLRRDEAILVRVGGIPKHLVTTWDLLKILSELEAFRRLLIFEEGLRGLIEQRLSTSKKNWWSSLPEDIREYAVEIGEESLRALTMDHLRRIIYDNQSVFRYELTDPKLFKQLDGRLIGIRNMRNDLVHGRKDPAELKEKLIQTIGAVEAMLPVRQFVRSV
jgi:hypothetical protein